MIIEFDDLLKSPTADARGIRNIPGEAEVECLKMLLDNLLQPINEMTPLRITSGYRCRELNKAVGGVDTPGHISQHVLGMAADCQPMTIKLNQLMNLVISSGLEFDQLILEHGSWVHMSYNKGKNRKQAFIIGLDGAVTPYKWEV